jgi:3'(2'), 5'-bisphosphate nucleotidase
MPFDIRNSLLFKNGTSMERRIGLVRTACELARKTGDRIRYFYEHGSAVTWKQDSSPLTSADSASHDFLVKSLRSLTPDVPIVSEESDEPTNYSLHIAERFWLVDPLDGTKEFIKRTNEFTVNLALIEERQPVLGVVHAPALGRTYYGLRNSGAWCQTRGSETRISSRRANRAQLAIVASKDHAGPLVSAMLARVAHPQLQSMGSSLKFCLVAEGKADIYLRDLPTMEWDTAPAQCIVEAAGGRVCSLDRQPLHYAKPGWKNPAIMTVGDSQFDWRPLVEAGPAV